MNQEEPLVKRIFTGDFEYVPDPRSSLVRIFLSSTFSGITLNLTIKI
jgi:hypothetical protein